MKNHALNISILVVILSIELWMNCRENQAFARPVIARNVPAMGKPATPDPVREVPLRQRLVDYAKRYLGTRYMAAGTDPGTGFDCSGFVAYVFQNFNLKLSHASAELAYTGTQVPLDRVQAGDLMIFKDGSRIQHVAMVVERTSEGIFCIHCTCTRGVIVENVSTSSYWSPRIWGARDVLGR